MTKPTRRKQQTWGWLGAALIAGSLAATAAGTGLLAAREEATRAAAAIVVDVNGESATVSGSSTRLQLQLDLPPIPEVTAPSFSTARSLAPFTRSRSSR